MQYKLAKGFPPKSRAISDLVIIGALSAVVLGLALVFDVCEPLLEFVLSLKSWRLDELLIVMLVLSLAFAVYSLRRYQELRQEVGERRRAEALATGQSQILELVARGTALPQVLEALANMIEAQSEQALCSIMLLDQNGVNLHVGAAPHLPLTYLQAIEGAEIGPVAGSCGTACYLHKPVFVLDIATDPLWADYRTLALSHDLQACWCLPIYTTDGKILGTFAMYYKLPKSPSPREISLIEVATHIAGIAIERQLAEQALHQYAQRLKNLHEIDHAILAAQSSTAIVEGALGHIRQLVPCSWANMVILERDSSKATVLSTGQDTHDFVSTERDVPLERFGITQELYQGQVYYVEDVLVDLNSVQKAPAFPTQNLRSYLNVPLISEGQLLGFIGLGAAEPRAFRPEYIQVAQEVAVQLAVAIQNARLFEQVQASRERLQVLSQLLVEAQESERRRISRELHDEVGQALTVLKINLQSSLRFSVSATPLSQRLEESIGLVDQTLQQVRNISLDLRPSLLDDLGLVAALRWHIDNVTRRTNLVAHFRTDLLERRLPPELETTCFRVAQEALTNVVRHAQARRVQIELFILENELHLIVQDDGIGFDLPSILKRANEGGSLGLLGLQERVALMNGRIEIESEANGGTLLHAYFPLSDQPVTIKRLEKVGV